MCSPDFSEKKYREREVEETEFHIFDYFDVRKDTGQTDINKRTFLGKPCQGNSLPSIFASRINS